MIRLCPVCRSSQLSHVFSHQRLPTYNLNYASTRQEALEYSTANVNFVECRDCTFVFNRIYKQLDYQVPYEAGRSGSATFDTYLSDVSRTITHYLQRQISTVVEIGAGDCSFARKFLNLRSVEYHAFDPSWTEFSQDENLYCHNAYYEASRTISPDLLILRHVLEHQSAVINFLTSILHEQPQYVCIEVPCYEFVENHSHYHYFSNEHCSYFTIKSLIKTMADLGYKKCFAEYVFGGEYILGLWQITDKHLDEERRGETRRDEKRREAFVDWKERLSLECTEHSILWGVGGKGVMVMNLLSLGYDKMPYVIDLNPKLWGKYVPYTANEVVSPETLRTLLPSRVIVLNPLYQNEIKQHVKELGLKSDVISLFKSVR